MVGQLSDFERDVIATILAPAHPVMEALRAQLSRCEVMSREFTGVGFFTELEVPTEIERAPVNLGTLHLSDVTAAIAGLEHGAGFVLFIQDGVLDLLEGFCYGERWPNSIARYEVTSGGVHHVGTATDIEEVDAAWVRQG